MFNRLIIRILYFFECFFKKDNLCPYCSSEKYKVIFKKGGIEYISNCLNCSLYWANPIFKCWKLYDFFYKETDMTTNLPSDEQLSNFLDTNFKGTEKDYLKVIEYFIEKYNIKRALDFGSSWGYFLYQLKSFDVECVGVEISDKRRRFGIEKLKVRIEKRLEDLIINREKFDVIFSIHTLEHFTNIRNIFKIFHDLLNDKGILFIETPRLFKNSKETFRVMGAIHPLGFTRDFFLKNLPMEGFETEVYEGYKDLVGDFQRGENSLVVIGIKK